MIVAGTYCIDTTEVTNDDYAAWLGSNPDVGAQAAECAWNTTFTPAGAWPPAADELDHPVTYVDWCDAAAYCAAAQKHLCGEVGGSTLAPGDFADPSKSQWFRACTVEGSNDFPYGDAYAQQACNGTDYTQPDRLLAVKEAASCHGTSPPYADVYDMSGNVHEWEDACSGTSGASDTCRRRGGSYKSGETALRCDGDDQQARNFVDATTGFRCCAF